MTKKSKAIVDETNIHTWSLVKLRLPWLIIGLVGGVFAIALVAGFEEVLHKDVRIAFFVPFIVYIADAVGAQTETIYVRYLASRGHKRYGKYMIKEFAIGILLGIIIGIIVGFGTLIWLQNPQIAVAVGLASAASIAISPVVALLVPTALERMHRDPAVGAGPFTTILQDIISLLIYFVVVSAIVTLA